jgi:hypothetical protein
MVAMVTINGRTNCHGDVCVDFSSRGRPTGQDNVELAAKNSALDAPALLRLSASSLSQVGHSGQLQGRWTLAKGIDRMHAELRDSGPRLSAAAVSGLAVLL